MSRLFSATELAALRRQFYDSLAGTALEAVSAELREQVEATSGVAGAASAKADAAEASAASATQAASDAQDAADAAQLTADQALAAAGGAATPESVQNAIAAGTNGLASEFYVDSAEADAKAYADGLVVDMATTGYVDGKFPAVSGSFKVVDLTDTKEVTITITNGVVTAFERAP